MSNQKSNTVMRIPAAKIGMILALVISGFILGLMVPERSNPLRSDSHRQPDVSVPAAATLPPSEIEYRKECVKLGYAATQGDLESALALFNRYSYGERDYQKSYYWAVLAERQGYDTKFGSLVEMAEGNIEAVLYAEFHRPDEPRESARPANQLPPR